jgi:hypothetical protein
LVAPQTVHLLTVTPDNRFGYTRFEILFDKSQFIIRGHIGVAKQDQASFSRTEKPGASGAEF